MITLTTFKKHPCKAWEQRNKTIGKQICYSKQQVQASFGLEEQWF